MLGKDAADESVQVVITSANRATFGTLDREPSVGQYSLFNRVLEPKALSA